MLLGDKEVYVIELADHHRIIDITEVPPPEPRPDPLTVPTITGGFGTIFLDGGVIENTDPSVF